MGNRVLTVFTTVSLAALASLSAGPASAHDRNIKGDLIGYQEVPAVSTEASGQFEARISQDGSTISYELTYQGLEGDVRQAHIHFGQVGVNGSIVVFLCQTTANPDPTGLARTCLQEGTVSGTLTVANMNPGPTPANASAQGIAVGEFGELIQAIRAKVAYANVHSTKFPGGEIRAQLR